MKHPESPYLADPNRLQDVIAAIQAMGIYRFYKLDFATWSKRISGTTERVDHWSKLFTEHPEFFRVDEEREKVSLVLRRQRRKRYDTVSEKLITTEEYSKLDSQAKSKVSREPLTPDQIEALIEVAIKLHTRAAEQQRDKRWWFPPVLALAGVIVGALMTAALKPAPTSPAVPPEPPRASVSR